MPPKIRTLMQELESAGFVISGGKGSHRKYTHAKVQKPVVLSGKPGDDALAYQQTAVIRAIEESKR